MTTALPRRFHLQRDTDITGVSGTGRVADGILWPDGSVAIRWRGDRPSTVHWDRIADAEHVHGHHGATRVEWDDDAADRPITLSEAADIAEAVALRLHRGHEVEPANGAYEVMSELRGMATQPQTEGA